MDFTGFHRFLLVPNKEPHTTSFAQRIVDSSHLEMEEASLTTGGMEMHMRECYRITPQPGLFYNREQKKWGFSRHPVHMESDTNADNAIDDAMVD